MAKREAAAEWTDVGDLVPWEDNPRLNDSAAAEAADRALDLLASALADLLITEARAEVAAELGLDEAAIDRERGRAARPPRSSLALNLDEPR